MEKVIVLRQILRRLAYLGMTCLSLSAISSAQQKPFYLHSGDTVVFYGDSITEQRFYTQFVEIYTATRFPHMPVQFFTAGVGGDTVYGRGGGPIDLRLSRDVFSLKPTVVTIMLGMNDGGYHLLDAATETHYTTGYEHILTSLQQALPTTRITLLGPSPYDEVTRPETFAGGYNATLVRFSAVDAELAAKHSATYIDLNAPFVAALKQGLAINPLATELLLPDRVHPEQITHWLMAASLLKGWNAPALVSSVTIDATAASQATISSQKNSQVSALQSDPTSLQWTELDEALPLPLDDNKVSDHFIRSIYPLDQELNQQPLTVTGLKPGDYELDIDGRKVGQFTGVELGQGINLAKLNTPMRAQAYTVSWTIRDRDDTHYVRLRMQIDAMKSTDSHEQGIQQLLNFEQVQQAHIYELAQPKPHSFQIKAIAPIAPAPQNP
jgi:lysophospholipase L1-like esterase